ncbi:MAG: alanine racemase, partial [Rickettsiales bacterium]
MEPPLAPPYATAPTVTINLDALTDNFHFLSEKVYPAECGAVVKTNAYGLGMGPIARTLAKAGCEHFFVATAGSGAELRDLLANEEIFIFHGVCSEEEAALTAAYNLIPVISTPRQLAVWKAYAHKTGVKLPTALQIDSGINRLGFPLKEVQAMVQDADAFSGLDLRMVMSHLACSYEPEHALTQQQFEIFAQMQKTFPGIRSSLVNSAGLFYREHHAGEIVRAGGALYGLNPPPAGGEPMECVVTLEAPILQIRTMEREETVGYAATYTAKSGARIATIAIGYADGLLFCLGNKGKIWLAGYEVPIVGKVSMDLITVDISELPEGAVQEGDMA